MKKTVAAGIIVIMIMIMVTASASTAGTSTDPLITLSYLEGTYAASLRTDVTGMLGGAADAAISRLDDILVKYKGYNFAPRFTYITIAEGDALILPTGGSFTLLSGSASLTVIRGAVINVSDGSEAMSSSRMNLYQRYFCAEDTVALITANSASTGHVDGRYIGGGTAPPETNDNAQQSVFDDVRETDWFFTAVDYVYKNDLFKGTTATSFSPGTAMTRAMFVTVLYRMEYGGGGSGFSGAGAGFWDPDSGFSDVREGEWYSQPVMWASAHDIVAGYDDGTFLPDTAVTREQMATIMHRYAAFKERDMTAAGVAYDTFPDSGVVSSYADQPMRWAVSWGVINGSNGLLLPRNTATRAEVAQIIYNYAMKIGI